MTDLPPHLARVPVGRDPFPPETLASHQRQRLMSAATGVFAERGYQETTIDNIVGAAKASVGSFYSLFGGKEECFLAVFDDIVERSRSEIIAALEEAESWGEGAVLGLGKLLSLFVSAPQAARIVLVEAQTAGEAATVRYESLLDAAGDWLRAGRAGKPRAAVLTPSFERASIAGLAFYLQQQLFSPETDDWESLLEETAPLLLEPIIGLEALTPLLDRAVAGP